MLLENEADQLEYSYLPLCGDDIRVLHLLPGHHEEPLRFHLIHQPISRSESSTVDPNVKKRFQNTLPAEWKAYRTPEGKWFYHDGESTANRITYEHPLPAVNACSQPASIKLEQHAGFETLSYAWGDPERHHPAYVVTQSHARGDEDSRVLYLTQNLNVALRYLRHSDHARALWVDAICINQDDLEERTAQVLRMRHIYSSADRLVAWLGLPTSDSQIALETLAYLGQQVEVSDDGYRFAAPEAEEPDWFRGKHALPYTDSTWSMINELFSRPFFQRLWIQQELFLASKESVVQCGYSVISWPDFRRAVIALDSKAGIPINLTLGYHITGLRAVAYGSFHMNFHDVYYLSKQHDCADARDKIYGAHAFFGPALRDSIQPSYGMPAERAFQNVFLKYSEVANRLDLLSKCYLNEENAALPSWIPDWVPLPGSSLYPGPGHHASGLSEAHYHYESEDRSLEVLGINIDELDLVFPLLPSGELSPMVARLSEMMASSTKPGSHASGGCIRDAWLQTLLEGTTKDRYPTIHLQTLEEWTATVTSLVESGSVNRDHVGVSVSLGLAGNSLTLMKYFQTSTGYLGYSHCCVEREDHLCVILGVSVPLILRPKGDYYQVVGWAYVYGLMDAEAILGRLPLDHIVEQHLISSRYRSRYRNSTTNELVADDPRLEPLPTEWEMLPSDAIDLTPDDPLSIEHFRNTITGEIINHDPRMDPELIAKRGVKLQKFRLC